MFRIPVTEVFNLWYQVNKIEQLSHGQREAVQCTRKCSYQNNICEVTGKQVIEHPEGVLIKTSKDKI